MYSLMLGTGELLQCEKESELEEVPVGGGGEEECHQNGNGGLEAALGETKTEQEHNSDRSADSPSEGQQ